MEEVFHVARVSRRIVIKPSWEKYKGGNDDCVVGIDPGMSFGTGLHATTRSCLKFIDRLSAERSRERRSFLDIGCGSGVLAIAAAKLGFKSVTAVDNDPVAVKTARGNFRRNGVAGRIRCFPADLESRSIRGRFDVVAANILAGVLRKNTERLAALLARSGNARLILSGITVSQYSGVRRACEKRGLREISSAVTGGWKSGVFGRKIRAGGVWRHQDAGGRNLRVSACSRTMPVWRRLVIIPTVNPADFRPCRQGQE